MMDFRREEIEEAALVLVVDQDGRHKWSSTKSDDEVAQMMATIAQGIWARRHRFGKVPVQTGRVR